VSSSRSASTSPCSTSAEYSLRGPRLKSACTRRSSVPTSAGESLLDVKGLVTGYRKIIVRHGVDLAVRNGEDVALLGPNGAGKTTLLRAVSGLLPINGGSAMFAGQSLKGLGPRETARSGLTHVIEGHRVFTQQSVADNLLLAAYDLPRGERSARVE